MAMPEIDSFIGKFKNLLYLGVNAHLEIKSEAGKAFIKLTAEVDVCPQHPAQSRRGPSHQRRRERRAAEREAAAEAAQENSVVEKAIKTKSEQVPEDTLAVNANEESNSESKSEEAEKVALKEDTRKPTTEEVVDEVCPNYVYNKTKPKPTTSGSEGPGPPSTSPRKPPFDYYSLTYDDLSDPD